MKNPEHNFQPGDPVTTTMKMKTLRGKVTHANEEVVTVEFKDGSVQKFHNRPTHFSHVPLRALRKVEMV